MPFDLYIRLGGVCLLHDRGTELRVLLPDLRNHAEPHVAVIGSESRYQPNGMGAACANHFFERSAPAGQIQFDTFEFQRGKEDDLIRPDFLRFNIPNVQPATLQAPPDRAHVWMSIPKGRLDGNPDASNPARWTWPPRGPRVCLATWTLWKVTGLINKVDGKEGIGVTLGDNTRPTFSAVNDELGLHIFNVPSDEVLCKGRPPNHPMAVDEDAPHFDGFYGLFQSPAQRWIPKFCNDGSGDTQCRPSRLGQRLLNYGLRYTCLLAGYQEPQ